MILATITSRADGYWTSTSTWASGTVPTQNDTVVLRHHVYLAGTSHKCVRIIFEAGAGLSFDPAASPITTTLTLTNQPVFYGDQAVGTIRTDGIAVSVPVGIYCTVDQAGDIPKIAPLPADADVIIDDPGYISAGSTLQDIRPEGCARAYARKVSNNVRYATVTVRIRASKIQYAGRLLRMAECPYPVLLATDTFLLKGFVETVATDASSVGKEFIAYKVTVAEAL